jgi:two-component system response regulator BaeR
VKGNELNLTPSEFEILSVLMSSPNRVFTRTQLIEKVQGYSFDGYERTIDFHIKNLRKKIAEYLPGEKIIQSAYGYGYKMVL